jgi:hypothetical protein
MSPDHLNQNTWPTVPVQSFTLTTPQPAGRNLHRLPADPGSYAVLHFVLCTPPNGVVQSLLSLADLPVAVKKDLDGCHHPEQSSLWPGVSLYITT